MSNFAEVLQEKLEADPKRSRRAERILKILKARPSRARDRRIARMENHARGAVGIDPTTGEVDWRKEVDWKKWLDIIIKVLMAILPLLI